MAADPLHAALSRLQGAYEQIGKRFDDLRRDMEQRFAEFRENIDRRFAEFREDIDRRFDSVDRGFASIEARLGRLESGQWRLVALIVATWATTMLAIFFHK